MGPVRSCVLAIWLTFLVSQAHAHHSFVGQYDSAKLITLRGVVASVQYRNLHIFFRLRVKGRSGGVQVWRIETESIPLARRKGLSQQWLKSGASITVTGWPARKGNAAMGLKSIDLPGGKRINLRGSAR